MIYIQSVPDLAESSPCSASREKELALIKNTSVVREKRAAEAALWRAFSDRYPKERYPFDYPRTDRGKPYFPQYPDFHFSLTHTPDLAACARADVSCGLDMELVGRIGERVVSNAFNPVERDYVLSLDPENRSLASAQIWCMREAYGKMLGCGITYLDRGFYALPSGDCSDKDCSFSLFAPDDLHAGALCIRGKGAYRYVYIIHL